MNLAKIQFKGTQVILWDLGGQLKMRKIWEKYYGEANAVIFVIDSSDITRLQENKQSYDGVCDHDSLSKIPIMTFANKQDIPVLLRYSILFILFQAIYYLQGALRVHDLSLTFPPRLISNSHNKKEPCSVFPISALTG